LSRNSQGHTKEGKKVAEMPNGSTENKDISSEDPKEKKASVERYASVYPGPNACVDNKVSDIIKRLESALGFPIWLMIQDGGGKVPYDSINYQVFAGFRNSQKEILDNKPVGLLIESSGGDADYAYQIARLFQRRTKNFTVIVPRYAKSAATLIALGATDLIMGRDAELGPLDVQVFDLEREEYGSALNAVQSLERLNAFSMTAIDQLMPLLIRRTGRKIDTLLPKVLDYAVAFVKPLLEKIDAIDYTKKSRDLKVAEQYAFRLLKSRHSWSKAIAVARSLVEKFPTHGFVIDRDEAKAYEKQSEEPFGLGLPIKDNPAEVEDILNELVLAIDGLTLIGYLKEVQP
jgi:hypothetical protein